MKIHIYIKNIADNSSCQIQQQQVLEKTSTVDTKITMNTSFTLPEMNKIVKNYGRTPGARPTIINRLPKGANTIWTKKCPAVCPVTKATLDWYTEVMSPHTRRDSKHLL